MERFLLPLQKLIIFHRIKGTLVVVFFSALSAKLNAKTFFNISHSAVFNYLFGMGSNQFFSV
jgi:hypothetical protein